MPFALDAIRPRLRPSLVALLVVTIVAGLVGSQSISATNTRGNGYWIALALGDVRAFGDAPPLGGTSRVVVTDMATTPTGRGYWLATALGPIVSIGDARAFVSGVRHGGPIVAIGARPQGDGVWLLSSAGDVLPFGAARAFAALDRRIPLIDLAVTPSGEGFWALDIAGGVQARGDATAHGNAPAARLAIAIAPTPSGDGYWVLSASGRVVAVGAASSFGSAARSAAYVDMAVTHSGRGYWLLDAFGRVTTLGDAVHYGDLGGPSFLRAPAVAIAATPFVNLPPIAVDDAASLDEDMTVDVAVLANDGDPEGDPLSVRITVPPLRGTATVLPDGKIRYTPAPNVNGTDQLTYEVDDGLGGRASAVVRFTIRPINDAPAVANPIADQTASEDAADLVLDLASVFSDVDIATNADSLTLIVTGNTNPALVTATLSGSSLTLDFALNGNGSADITIRATDSAGLFAADTFRVTVSPVNDAPVAINDTYTTAEDTVLNVPAPGVLANDSDVDGDALSAALVTGPTQGTLILQPSGAFAYTPNANRHGADSFTYSAVDPSGASSTATVAITVTPVNDAPVATNDTYTVTNTTTLNVSAPGVLGNDADVDGDALSASLVAGPAVGTLTLDANGSFSYTPPSGHVGTVTFTYLASDGTLTDDATVSISVTSGGGGGTGSFNFGTPIPELFDFESYNGFPATPGHIGRETLGGVEVEILGPWWLE